MEKHVMEQAQQFDEKRFTKIDMIKTKNSVAFMLNFLPEQHMKPHAHPNRELYLLVIKGTGTLHIDGKDIQVKEGDVIFCHEKEQIGFTNTSGDNVSIYTTMTKVK